MRASGCLPETSSPRRGAERRGVRAVGLGRIAAGPLGPLCLLATLIVVGSLAVAVSTTLALRQHLSASGPSIAAAGGQSGASSTLERRDRFPSLVDQQGPTRHCGEMEIPEANDGSAMEVDVFGRRAPRCRFARRKLRGVPWRAPERRWERLGRWNCIWETKAVVCKRGRAALWATNPGD